MAAPCRRSFVLEERKTHYSKKSLLSIQTIVFSDSGRSKGTQTRGIVEFGPLRMTEGGEAKKGSEYAKKIPLTLQLMLLFVASRVGIGGDDFYEETRVCVLEIPRQFYFNT